MAKLLDEIKTDVAFIKSHTLQPQWYKVFKIILLVGFFLVYNILFGLLKTIVFFAIFFFFGVLIHMTYRIKTNTWTRSWLDFKVTEEDGVMKPTGIGLYYYLAIAVSAVASLIISQVLV
jgi:hypothetical protein